MFSGIKTAQQNMRPFGTGPIGRFLRLIRFSHTIFALPFALAALIVAANGWPSMRIFLLVIVCMVFARTAAMLFNRLVDWSLDQRNPRTASRHLLVSKLPAAILLILSSAGVSSGGVSDQSADFHARTCCAGFDFFLLADETVHQRDAFLSRTGAGHRSGRRLDRADGKRSILRRLCWRRA